MNRSRIFYGLLAVVGLVFLPAFFYWCRIGEEVMFDLMPSNYLLRNQLMGYFSLFFWIGGAVFFTVGIWGFGRQYFKSSQREFVMLAAILVPFFYSIFVMALVLGMIKVGL